MSEPVPKRERQYSPEIETSPWLVRVLNAFTHYEAVVQDALQHGQGDEFVARHERMQALADALFKSSPEMQRVWVTAMGSAEEGQFDPETVGKTVTRQTREELDTFFAAEPDKGEVALNAAVIARVHDGVMDLHVPPLSGNPMRLYRSFLEGLQNAVHVAREKGVGRIVLTSWMLGDVNPQQFDGYGELSEEGIPEGVRREAQYGGALYNTKHFQRYITTGALPTVKTITFTPDSLDKYLHAK